MDTLEERLAAAGRTVAGDPEVRGALAALVVAQRRRSRVVKRGTLSAQSQSAFGTSTSIHCTPPGAER